MWKQWLIALSLVAVAIGAAVTYQKLDTGPAGPGTLERPATVVNTVQPQWRQVRDQVQAVGSLRAMNAVELTTEVSGRVVALNLQTGRRVQKGEILVQLDDRQARADLQIIEARLADARRQLERAQRLRSNSSIAQSQVDELRTAVDVAEAERQAAQVRLENHHIKAPFAGVVGLSDLSVGAYVSAGTGLATLDATDPMELDFAIPERYLAQVHLGQQVQGLSSAYPDAEFGGILSELGTRIDQLSRTLPVRAVIANPDGRLRPGQFMSVSLTLQQRQALVIPEQAVIVRGDESYVFVARDGKARRLPVDLGARMPGLVEVSGGLSHEDRVVVAGQDRLSSGERIQVVEEDNLLPDNRFSSFQGS